jgi:hypothetical protein
MARYKVTVFERTVQEYYEFEVEADSAEEAKRKALQEYELNDDADAHDADREVEVDGEPELMVDVG